jgi:ABC-type nitrate/sulfonate/bicarbonate transport system substrate-binding protein
MKKINHAPAIPRSTSILLVALLAIFSPIVDAAAPSLTKITFPYSPINSSSLHWMLAKDARIFDKYGLDVDLVYMGASSLILQSMLSGSAHLAGFGGPAIVSNVLKGGDVITVAATASLNADLPASTILDFSLSAAAAKEFAAKR